MEYVLISLALLGVIGLVAAILLYAAAKRFAVHEDPRIAEIEAILPGANCGACGFSGCSGFARACAKATTLEGMHCTSLDDAGMKKIADIVGLAPSVSVRKVALIQCQNSCEVRNPLNHYDGVSSCAIEHSLYQGESDCIYGCLGLGDCARACPFGAMTLPQEGTLPVVDLEKCTGCGKCVEACPRSIPVLAEAPAAKDLVWIACKNSDRGPVAMKECNNACIGCGKCKKTCAHDAITVTSFLATIDSGKCTGCGDCAEVCPRGSILTIKSMAPTENVCRSRKEAEA